MIANFTLSVVTSVLYDVDAGFGGVAGVPLVFIASYFLKRILVRDEQVRTIYNTAFCKVCTSDIAINFHIVQ